MKDNMKKRVKKTHPGIDLVNLEKKRILRLGKRDISNLTGGLMGCHCPITTEIEKTANKGG